MGFLCFFALLGGLEEVSEASWGLSWKMLAQRLCFFGNILGHVGDGEQEGQDDDQESQDGDQKCQDEPT